MRRGLIILAVAVAAAGCRVPAIDYDGTAFACDRDGVCPEGFECSEGMCVIPGTQPDAAPDGEPASQPVRQLVLVDHSAGSAALVDFPLLVRLDGASIDLDAAGDAGSLRFETEAGDPLAHELDHWATGVGGAAWVKVPRIEPRAEGARLVLLYGDAAAGSEDPAAVWADYTAVYHLEAGSDSSPSGFDGVDEGATAAPAFIGGGRAFATAGDNVDLGSDRAFLQARTQVTVSAWVLIDPALATSAAVFASSVDGAGVETGASRISIGVTSALVPHAIARSTDAGAGVVLDGTAPLAVDTWVHLALAVDYAADTMEIYVDGVSVAAASALGLGPTSPDSASTRTRIGANEVPDSELFLGLIDEVRLTPRLLDADRIAAARRADLGQMVTIGSPL